MDASAIAAARQRDRIDAGLADAFGHIVGRRHVITAFDVRLAYARDRLPFAVFRERVGDIAGAVPRLIVRPADAAEVAAIARANDIPLIP